MNKKKKYEEQAGGDMGYILKTQGVITTALPVERRLLQYHMHACCTDETHPFIIQNSPIRCAHQPVFAHQRESRETIHSTAIQGSAGHCQISNQCSSPPCEL